MSREPREESLDRREDDEQCPTVGELFPDDAVIAVPAERFEGLDAPEEMLDFLGQPRYEWAAKDFDRWITTGPYVVRLGTLYGVDPTSRHLQRLHGRRCG